MLHPLLLSVVLAALPSTGSIDDNCVALADDSALVGDSSGLGAATAVPDCDDTGGNHLNYDTGTNAFSCGTSGATATCSQQWCINFNAHDTATRYISPNDQTQDATATNVDDWIAVAAGTINGMRCEVDTAPGSLTGREYFVRNETTTTDISASCGISDTSTASSSAGTLSFSAGDKLVIKSTVTSTPADDTQSRVCWCVGA